MGAIELDLTIRSEQQDAVAAQMAQQIMQKRKRALIGPVQVVDEHQQPALRGERAQQARGAVEHPQALLARRKRRVGRERAQLDLDLGCEFGDLGRGRAERRS